MFISQVDWRYEFAPFLVAIALLAISPSIDRWQEIQTIRLLKIRFSPNASITEDDLLTISYYVTVAADVVSLFYLTVTGASTYLFLRLGDGFPPNVVDVVLVTGLFCGLGLLLFAWSAITAEEYCKRPKRWRYYRAIPFAGILVNAGFAILLLIDHLVDGLQNSVLIPCVPGWL